MVYFYLIVTEMCASSIDTFWLFINYAQTRYILNKSQADFFLIEFVDITIYNDSALTVSFRICLSWSQHKMHFSWNQQYAWASCHFSVALLGRSSVSVIFAQKAWHTLSHFVSVTNNFSQQGIVSIQSWAWISHLI